MSYLLLGFSLGLSAGLSPGPLLALLIQRTLSAGFGGGLRVALAPFVSDLPIVALSLLLVGRLPAQALDAMLAVGGVFVLWLGIDAGRQALRRGADVQTTAPDTHHDLWRAALINLLNPHPYLFWTAVGAPTILRAWRESPGSALGFVVMFYLLLVGSKIVLAYLLSRAHALSSRWRWRLQIGSALLLLGAGFYMLFSAWQQLT